MTTAEQATAAGDVSSAPSRLLWHVALPAMAPAAVIALYFTPVTLFGCVNRGWAALGVVFVSLVAGIVAALLGLREKQRGQGNGLLWALSAAILALPAILVLGPLG